MSNSNSVCRALICLAAACLIQWSVGVREARAQPGGGASRDAETAASIQPPPALERMANPYGLGALWAQGDPVMRGTLVVLLFMSIGTWYIAAVKFAEQTRLMREAKEAQEKFWQAASVSGGIAALDKGSAFRTIAARGAAAAEHHGRSVTPRIDLNAWIGMSLQRAVDAVGNRLQWGLAFLATAGSTAPFVGLFGTVWGIYHALTAIGVTGQASIDKVAGPVGEALIMTALGLAVAVPAVIAYNALLRRNRVAMETVRDFAATLHMTLLGGVETRDGA